MSKAPWLFMLNRLSFLGSSKKSWRHTAIVPRSAQNGMRPVYPGEVLRENFMRPVGLINRKLMGSGRLDLRME